MRLRAALLRAGVTLTVLPMLALAACAPAGTASQTGESSASGAASSAASSSASPTTFGPSVPAETAVASAVPRDQMPTVSGSFGTKPTITVPSTPPPDTLQRVVLSKGDGPTVVAGDWLKVNYLGQVWGGKVFDNSYDRGSEFTVQVGGPQQMVVAGWDVGLRGVTGGSRVLLSFPPQDGYGPDGKAPDISGTDTLIFVVDVVTVIPTDAAGDKNAAPQSTPSGLPSVGGQLGAEPTLSVPTSLPQPTETKVVVLAKGTGSPAQAGDVLVQYVATTWDGTDSEKSWPDPTGKDTTAGTGPESLPLSSSSEFADLIGVPMGSRVLMTMPADSTNGTPALAWVLDLIDQQDVASTATGSASATASQSNAPPTAPTS